MMDSTASGELTWRRAARAVLPEGVRDDVAFGIRDGRIETVRSAHDVPQATPFAPRGIVLPGLVDSHVHINEPGRAEWEGFATATRAAAAGGVTTLVDMPLNSIPATTTAAALEAKRAAARGHCQVDVAFWGGVVPGNTAELPALAAAGVRGFKTFMSPSGVEEFPSGRPEHLAEAMPVVASLGLPLLVHAEWPPALDAALAALGDPDWTAAATWLASRPPNAETQAIDCLIDLARSTGCHVHVVHLATTEALAALRRARGEGLPITVETCPHYLTFASDQIGAGATEFKCAPPIRDAGTRDGLWQALADGDIDLIASDHSPCPPALKERDSGRFDRAWGGISSLELSLAVVHSGARARGLALE